MSAGSAAVQTFKVSSSGNITFGKSDTNATITTNGTGDLILNTNSGTNSGNITITDGADNNITLTPNGSGKVVVETDLTVTGSLKINSSLLSLNHLNDVLIENNSIYLGNDPSSTTDTAQKNIAIGTTALDAITTGDYNISIGYDSLTNNTTGTRNIGIGLDSLKANVTGNDNIAIGSLSQNSITNTSFNISMGHESLNSSTGEKNIAFGYQVAKNMINGDENIFIGHMTNHGKNSDKDAHQNIIIGAESKLDDSSNSVNQVIIGYNITNAYGNNVVILGNSNITDIYMSQDKGATVHAAGITSATGNFTIDNTNATGQTNIQLGTDDANTKFQVLDDSGNTKFSVDGSGGCLIGGISFPLKTGSETLTASGALTISNTNLHTMINSSAGSQTSDLADGTTGQLKIITMIVAGNDHELTPDNLSGGAKITFNAVGQSVQLLFDGTNWTVLNNIGATIS